ncbi:uncharacterized protein LOC113169156 [Anabas testudineus]|uniref:uncharacterized protein LOC113169156 n=1 Tax=Anabas testudineus TaxID=64144 RepID=UPI000E462B1D|nr:uncharacterized protein LOC113169156 [Anabas testudineus]
MLRIVLPQSLILNKWGWTSWMFLYFMVLGTRSLVTVHQPPVITAALGHDVIMPCQLRLTADEKMVKLPVLYWLYAPHADNVKVWEPSETYTGRVDLLDQNEKSSNKSILLKSVRWADSGKYLCKLSVFTEKEKSFRRKGNETLLMVYDNIIINLTNHNDSRLQCEVNVSGEPGFVLSIIHNECKLPTVGSGQRDAVTTQPYVTLSESVSLMGVGKYECQLHLKDRLVTKSIFHYHVTVSGEDSDAGNNVSTICSTTLSGLVVVFPEPWLLYIALLLVPITFLLGILTARVLCKS